MKEYLPLLALPFAFLGIMELDKKMTKTKGMPKTLGVPDGETFDITESNRSVYMHIERRQDGTWETIIDDKFRGWYWTPDDPIAFLHVLSTGKQNIVKGIFDKLKKVKLSKKMKQELKGFLDDGTYYYWLTGGNAEWHFSEGFLDMVQNDHFDDALERAKEKYPDIPEDVLKEFLDDIFWAEGIIDVDKLKDKVIRDAEKECRKDLIKIIDDSDTLYDLFDRLDEYRSDKDIYWRQDLITDAYYHLADASKVDKLLIKKVKKYRETVKSKGLNTLKTMPDSGEKMKTKGVSSKNDLMDRLVEAIKEHSGMTEEEIKGVVGVGRGADAGYPGFTYFTDTVKFYDENEELIWDILVEMADDLGETPLNVIAGFGGAKDVVSGDSFKNLMSWFALEEASNYLQEEE